MLNVLSANKTRLYECRPILWIGNFSKYMEGTNDVTRTLRAKDIMEP